MASRAVIQVAHMAIGAISAIMTMLPIKARSKNPSMAQMLASAVSQISEPISTMAPIAVRNATNLVLGADMAKLTAELAGAECDAGCDILCKSEKGAAEFERNDQDVTANDGKFKILEVVAVK